MEKKLQRIPHEGAVAGVCAGLGVYFGVDKTWVRIAFIFSVFFAGYAGIGLFGPIIYAILWIVLPVKTFSIPQDPFNVDYRTGTSHQQLNDDYYDTSSEAKTANEYYSQPYTPKKSRDRYVAGIILLTIGLFFLLHQLNVFYWRDFARYWPVFIIFIGLATIFGAFGSKKSQAYPPFVNEKDQNFKKSTDEEDNGDEHTYTK